MSPRGPIEHLPYSLDVLDDGDNLVEVPGRVADLAVAHAAFEAAVTKYPDRRICIRERVITTGSRGRLIFALVRSSDRDR